MVGFVDCYCLVIFFVIIGVIGYECIFDGYFDVVMDFVELCMFDWWM